MPPNTEKDLMLAGAPYLASDPMLALERRNARRLSRLYNATTEDESERRREILLEWLGAIGESCEIEPPFRCDYGSLIALGDRFYANFGCVILDCNRVTIGRDVKFGPGGPCLRGHAPGRPRRPRLGSRTQFTGHDRRWCLGRRRVDHLARRDDRRGIDHRRGECRGAVDPAPGRGRRGPLSGPPSPRFASDWPAYYDESMTLEAEGPMSETAAPTYIVETTAENFVDEVVERSHLVPVVVDFWAEWCQPCRTLGPILEKLASEYQGRFILAKADTEKVSEIASRFGVRSIPAVFAVRGGEVVDSFVGVLPEASLRAWLDRIMPGPVEVLILEAKALEPTDVEAARAKYLEAVALAPTEPLAKIGLARLAMARGRLDEAHEIIDQLERRGYLEPEAETLKAQLTLRGQAEPGGRPRFPAGRTRSRSLR